jgi:hypothetical protein
LDGSKKLEQRSHKCVEIRTSDPKSAIFVYWIRPSGFHIFGFLNNNILYGARSSTLCHTPTRKTSSLCPPS